MSKLSRFHAMVTKALDPAVTVEEARTTAMVALRLLKSEGFVVSESKPSEDSPYEDDDLFEDIRPRAARRTNVSGVDPGDDVRRAQRVRDEVGRREDSSNDEYVCTDPNCMECNPPKKPGKGYVLFVSKYQGTCGVCDRPYFIGDPVWWKRSEKTMHARCSEAERKKK